MQTSHQIRSARRDRHDLHIVVASSGAIALTHFRVVLAALPPLLEGILLEAFSHALAIGIST